MKNLLKHLSPFAPDHSGAVSVLFELNGLILVCDAGGCTGNICGFDEPRWFTRKCALFSAALRDMDAILGRDDKLVSKLAAAMEFAETEFAAIIGTPVPAVIATDYRAIRKMTEAKTGKPVLAIETKGTACYDCGEEAAYLELVRTFSTEKLPVRKGMLNVLGATPLELSCCSANPLKKALREKGWNEVRCFESLDEFRQASGAEQNLVLAPAGLAAAEELKRKFGTPFAVDFPVLPENLNPEQFAGKRVLVIHQQFAANALRNRIPHHENVHAASFFRFSADYAQSGDFQLKDEENLLESVQNGHYDVVIGDPVFKRVLRNCGIEFAPFIHFAVSGKLEAGK